MKQIRLSDGSLVTLDDADFEAHGAFNWHAVGNPGKKYATRFERRGPGVRVAIRLHRVIAGAGPAQLVDHVNGDTTDNRRCNLRLCDDFGNHRNARKQRKPSASRFKGVAWMKHMGRWQARITVNGKKLFLGYFDSDEAGARAYDEAARKHHGAFACVNFPAPGERGALAAA